MLYTHMNMVKGDREGQLMPISCLYMHRYLFMQYSFIQHILHSQTPPPPPQKNTKHQGKYKKNPAHTRRREKGWGR